MDRLQYLTTGLALASAAASLPVPPSSSFVLVPDTWGDASSGAIPEFDLEVWGSTAIAMTNAVMYGGRLQTLVYADQTVTFSAATNKATKATHGLETGDGPVFFATAGGSQPPELVAGTGYYVIKSDANTFYLAASRALALAGTAIDLSTDGTGTTTISDSSATQRIYWDTHDGLLGLAGDGAIALTANVGYSKRIPHSPRVYAYALVATIDTGTVSAALYPIQSR